ncbi:MAG: domain containing protein [Ramlibacter sp.]|jgi:hypothetical protein|nr:domain containing protein [Ramlibacter sp.]MDB5915456.1 domain containing protein [Ramlibacter sp.]
MARELTQGAIDMFDQRLASNPLVAVCVEQRLARQLFVEAAKSCVGIRENPPNAGREVRLFQQTVDIAAGNAWCMGFVQSCLAYAELKTGKKSRVKASGACMSVWNGTPEDLRVKLSPLAGAIAIWQHTNDPNHGHTGIVLDCDGVSFHAIEGNTRDGYVDLNGAVDQQGDGVGFTHRRYDLFNPQQGDMQLRGFLKPY